MMPARRRWKWVCTVALCSVATSSASHNSFSLHQVDPLIRELVHYRDLIHQRTKEQEQNEPD
jgi:hypothetical protein